jgi:PAS domain S-box-containing protein
MLRIFNSFRFKKRQFFNYYDKENDFGRLTILYNAAALILIPIFCLIAYRTEIPKVFVFGALSLSVCFPFYVGLCWFYKKLRPHLAYFLLYHLYLFTYYTLYYLIKEGYELFFFLCFFVQYAVTVFTLQRLYITLFYCLSTLVIIVVSFFYVESLTISKQSILGIMFIYTFAALLVLMTRTRMINSIHDFINYLKILVNKPGSGYIIFTLENEEENILDFNDEACRFLLNKTPEEGDNLTLNKAFFHYFSSQEKAHIMRMEKEKVFLKEIKIIHDQELIIELKVIHIVLKNGKYWLVKLEDITSKYHEKRELINQEKKYRDLYFKNQAGVFTLNREALVLNCNEAFISLFEQEFHIGDFFFKEENKKRWEEILNDLDQKQSLRNEEFVYTTVSNQEKYFLFNWYIDSVTSCIEATVIDITSIKNASKAIEKSESKYRSIYEESNDAIFILEEKKIIDVNHQAVLLFNKKKEQLIGSDLVSLSGSLDEKQKNDLEQINAELKINRKSKFNWRFNLNEDYIEAEVSIVELTVEEKQLFLCVIHDVTENNTNLKKLDNSRRNLQAIMDNLPEGIVILSNNEAVYINPKAEVLLNKPQEGVLNINALFDFNDQILFEEMYKKHTSDRETKQQQFSLNEQSNLKVDVTLVSTVYEDCEATMMLIKDVSTQHKLTKEIARAEIAEESNKRLSKEIRERIKAEKLLQEQYLKSKAIFDSSSNTFMFTFNMEHEISSFNKHSTDIFYALTQEKLVTNKHYSYFFSQFFNIKQMRYFKHILNKVCQGDSQQVETKFLYKGQRKWLDLFFNPIYDVEGKVYEISLVAHDITEKKEAEKEIVKSLKEKEILLKEIHHRVKNNLQIISSILNLQSSFVQDENTLTILQDSRNRIRSMSMIHESMYRTNNFSSIRFSDYLLNIASGLMASYQINEDYVSLKTDLHAVDLVLDQAIPCALIVNELITNSLKYAFPENRKGVITICVKENLNIVSLSVEDNGIGFKEGFDFMNTDTLGLQLVISLTEQLDGKLEMKNEDGTKFLIIFDKTKV